MLHDANFDMSYTMLVTTPGGPFAPTSKIYHQRLSNLSSFNINEATKLNQW